MGEPNPLPLPGKAAKGLEESLGCIVGPGDLGVADGRHYSGQYGPYLLGQFRHLPLLGLLLKPTETAPHRPPILGSKQPADRLLDPAPVRIIARELLS